MKKMRTCAHVRARARKNFESCARARTRTQKFLGDAHAHSREKFLKVRTRTRKSRVFWNYGCAVRYRPDFYEVGC